MTSVKTAENIDEVNQRSLAILSRSITVSQGRFALTLVRCNYTALQQRLSHNLKASCPVNIQEVNLAPCLDHLWQPIIAAVAHQQQTAVMVYGLDQVENLADFLSQLDQDQAEFVTYCPFPITLWLTDEVLNQLIKLAPHFYASAITAITLRPSITELDILWREGADRLMGALIAMGLDRFIPNEQLGFCLQAKVRQELKSATKDLKNKEAVPPALTATWYLITGRDHYATGNLGEAIINYQKSLQIWEQLQEQTISGELSSFTHQTLQTRWALVKLHMGLCYHQQALSSSSLTTWQLARDTFLAITRIFEEQQRWDLVHQVLTLTGESLRALGSWLELENIANGLLFQPELEAHPLNIAQAHGFLAEVALQKNDFERAAYHARLALNLTREHQLPQPNNNVNLARYLLLVAKAEARSREFITARERLEKAQAMTPSNSALYLEIVYELRLLYFHTGQFWESFQLKQQQQLLRHQQGLVAFVGTAAGLNQPQTIVAGASNVLGREQDVEILVDRLSQPQQKLVVLHGESGMGKSSLLYGGVLPTLAHRQIDGCPVVIAQLQTYNNWRQDLATSLAQASGYSEVAVVATVEGLQQQLYTQIDRQLFTVLVLDQFEEFFSAVTTTVGRQEFYQFFQMCLSLPHVTIMIAMRQVDLHHLLEIERFVDLSVINENILDRQIRYPLRNFTTEQAQAVIQRLTNNCHYYLEPALAEQLVADLADEHAEISPVQLQVIGAQMQAEDIKTIGQYYQLSRQPQQYLIDRALEESIRDCGKENYEAVVTVLFLLTDGRGNRPQRTFSQLLPATSNRTIIEKPRHNKQPLLLAHQHNYYAQLLLLLNILVGSGIVSCTKSEPENLYQLIHADLVPTIRSRYQNRAATAPLKARRRWPKINMQRYGIKAWQRWIEPLAPAARQLTGDAAFRRDKVWQTVSTFATTTVERTGISKVALPLYLRLIGKKL